MRFWEILLISQQERGKDGLTLPFLIGSQNYLPETHIKQSIESLIVDIVLNGSFETCIRYCMGTQTFIFEIRKPRNNVYYPTYNDKEQSNLSISVFSKGDFGDNVENLIPSLIEKFQDKIDKGDFSAQPNVMERIANWKAFSVDEDIQFIENSYKSNNQNYTDTNNYLKTELD